MSSCQKDINTAFDNIDVDGYLLFREGIEIGEAVHIYAQIDDLENDVEACILFSSSLIDKVYCSTLLKGKGEFIVPKELNIQSGMITVDLLVAGNQISRCSTYVKAGAAVDIMEGFIGAKTLITDDNNSAMLVVIPIDSLNNFCEDGTDVQIQSVNTINQSETYNRTTVQGLTYQEYDGLKTTAKTSIGAISSESFMMEKEVKHVPGEPVLFNLKTTNVYPFADGRQTFDVSTSTIRDQYGNIVADGTVVDYIVSDKSGLSKFRSITTNGISNLLLRNPSEEVSLSVYAEVDGVRKSSTIQVYFKPYVLNYTVEFKSESNIILVGPISGSLGQIVPDGTEVFITLKNNDFSKVIRAQTLSGYVRSDLNDYSLIPGAYDIVIDISSNKKSIQISI